MSRVRGVKDHLAAALGTPEHELRAKFHNIEHHQAHAASAFFVSPFEEAAILTLDGFGDFASALVATGRGNRIEVLDRVLFPHSLGIYYTAVTQWLGFPKYGDEGKVMGLAPYGEPDVHRERMRDLLRLDGLFELNLDYFTHHSQGVDMTWTEGPPTIGRIFSPKLEEAFGPAREPEGELTKHHEDVAGAMQAVLEDAYLHVVNETQRRTGRRTSASPAASRSTPLRTAASAARPPSTGCISSRRRATAGSPSAPRTTSGTRFWAVRGAS